MAQESTPGPALTAAQLYQINAATSSANSANGGVFGNLFRDVNFSNLSLTNVGPLKGTPTALNGSGRGYCLSIPEKILAALQQAGEGCMKNLATGVQSASAAEVYGHGDIHHGLGGNGGNFTSMVSSGSHSEIEI